MLSRLAVHKRRILMTIDAVGGVWQYALGLAQKLVETGDTIVFAGLGPKPSAGQIKQAEDVGELYWLNTPPEWLARDASDLDGFHEELAPLVRYHAIGMLHLNAPWQAARLEVACPAVTVSHSCVASWFRAVKSASPPQEWAWQAELNRLGFDGADLVVAPSTSHSAQLEECYGPIAGLTVVHNSIEEGAAIEDRGDFVMAAGRWWDEGKNAAVLDKAAANVSARVVAVGSVSGPDGSAFRFRHAESLGDLPHRDTRRLMARARVFVSPSLYEPFGLAALEAASAATPLVLADIPTYRELWDGAAVFFPARNSNSLAAAVEQLIESPRQWERLSIAALLRSRQFTRERQAAAMRRAYEHAAASFAEVA